MRVMVDSCIYFDVLSNDPTWGAWSTRALEHAAESGFILLNAVIYAEVSAQVETLESLQDIFPEEVFQYEPIPREAAFLAGKCHIAYRRRGGQKTTPLADFFIGAHAAVLDVPLLTRDVARFQTYFPKLRLISP
jgi:predicted nucleic acid-binding protein